MQNSQNKNKFIIFLGVTLFVSGILLFASNYFNEKIDNAYSYMNNLLFESSESEIVEIEEEVDNLDEDTSSFQEEVEEEWVDPYLQYYIGTIEIPKINLNKGFTAIAAMISAKSAVIRPMLTSFFCDAFLLMYSL